jgi:hypothetical protein
VPRIVDLRRTGLVREEGWMGPGSFSGNSTRMSGARMRICQLLLAHMQHAHIPAHMPTYAQLPQAHMPAIACAATACAYVGSRAQGDAYREAVGGCLFSFYQL